MSKMISLEKIRSSARKIYENSSSIKVFQEELEDMLDAIDDINLEHNKGKISKEIFNSNEKKLKKESIKLIKRINKFVSVNLNLIKIMTDEITSQKIERKRGSNGD